MAIHMKMILLSLVMLLIALEPAFSKKKNILEKLDKQLNKMGLQKLQKFLADIGENAVEIGNNANEIDSNIARIDNNIGDVQNNIGVIQNEIDSNTAHINNNTMDIGTNTMDIGNNADEIDSNKAHIDNNAMDIQNDIGVIQNEIDSNTAHINNNTMDIGTNTLDIGNNTLDIQTLETMGSGSVWFDAVRDSNFDAAGSYRTITYSSIREASSYLGALNTGTGIFTAPLAGTYQFLLQVYKADDVHGVARIQHDGQIVSLIEDRVKSGSTNSATITGTAIVEMQPGQKVWAETKYNLWAGSGRNHFTGVLITPE